MQHDDDCFYLNLFLIVMREALIFKVARGMQGALMEISSKETSDV
jgi:hypothetical protein